MEAAVGGVKVNALPGFHGKTRNIGMKTRGWQFGNP